MQKMPSIRDADTKHELPDDIRAQQDEKALDKTKFYDDCVELVSSIDDLKQQLVNHVISLEEYKARVELMTQKANELIAI